MNRLRPAIAALPALAALSPLPQRHRFGSRRVLRGQSMVEYLVGLAIVTAIVAVPFDGHGSLVEYFLAMVRTAYLRFFTALALPA